MKPSDIATNCSFKLIFKNRECREFFSKYFIFFKQTKIAILCIRFNQNVLIQFK